MADPTRTERRLIDSIRKAKQDGEPAASTPAATPREDTAAVSASPAATPAPKPAPRRRRAPTKRPATTAQKPAEPTYQWGRRVWPD